ncbi:hypothetical protein HK101_006353, partial [Irineochytrium annulatum]
MMPPTPPAIAASTTASPPASSSAPELTLASILSAPPANLTPLDELFIQSLSIPAASLPTSDPWLGCGAFDPSCQLLDLSSDVTNLQLFPPSPNDSATLEDYLNLPLPPAPHHPHLPITPPEPATSHISLGCITPLFVGDAENASGVSPRRLFNDFPTPNTLTAPLPPVHAIDCIEDDHASSASASESDNEDGDIDDDGEESDGSLLILVDAASDDPRLSEAAVAYRLRDRTTATSSQPLKRARHPTPAFQQPATKRQRRDHDATVTPIADEGDDDYRSDMGRCEWVRYASSTLRQARPAVERAYRETMKGKGGASAEKAMEAAGPSTAFERRKRVDVGRAEGDLGNMQSDMGNTQKGTGRVQKDLGSVQKDLGDAKSHVGKLKTAVGRAEAIAREGTHESLQAYSFSSSSSATALVPANASSSSSVSVTVQSRARFGTSTVPGAKQVNVVSDVDSVLASSSSSDIPLKRKYARKTANVATQV